MITAWCFLLHHVFKNSVQKHKPNRFKALPAGLVAMEFVEIFRHEHIFPGFGLKPGLNASVGVPLKKEILGPVKSFVALMVFNP